MSAASPDIAKPGLENTDKLVRYPALEEKAWQEKVGSHAQQITPGFQAKDATPPATAPIPDHTGVFREVGAIRTGAEPELDIFVRDTNNIWRIVKSWFTGSSIFGRIARGRFGNHATKNKILTMKGMDKGVPNQTNIESDVA